MWICDRRGWILFWKTKVWKINIITPFGGKGKIPTFIDRNTFIFFGLPQQYVFWGLQPVMGLLCRSGQLDLQVGGILFEIKSSIMTVESVYPYPRCM